MRRWLEAPAALAAAWLAIVVLAAALAAAAQAEDDEPEAEAPPRIYKWIDENGIAHYTTDRSRIPDSLRRRTEQVGGSTPPLERDPVQARAPEPTTEISGSSSPAPAPARRISGSSHDAWVSRNRSSVSRDAWDEGNFQQDDGTAEPSAVPLTDEEVAALAVEKDEIGQRISELEAMVAADEIVLKEWVSQAGVSPFDHEDTEAGFLNAAQNLPQRLAELRELRERLDSLESP